MSHKDGRSLRNPAVITNRYISFGLMGLTQIVGMSNEASGPENEAS